MPCATSPSAIAWISSGCMPQNSAIWVKVKAVFSINHTAVALGISGRVIVHFPGPYGRPDAYLSRTAFAIPKERGDMASGPGWVKAADVYYALQADNGGFHGTRRRGSSDSQADPAG